MVAEPAETQEPMTKPGGDAEAAIRCAGGGIAPAGAAARTGADALAIIPAHDEGQRIGPVVRALVAQGLPVLVGDDGSSDDTAEAARAH